MVTSIYFDDESNIQSNKIYNIVANDMLSDKLYT